MVDVPDDQEKTQISYAKLISKENYMETAVIPGSVKGRLKKDGDFYLWIYIPGEDILKLSIYPIKSNEIQKILIHLEEFSPDLIKGISDILQKLDLGDHTIHTTGLCFSGENCYYETYIDVSEFEEKITTEKVMNEFDKIGKIK